MPTTSPSDKSEEITKELYSKNVELVHANKILELIHELYEIMISSQTVETVAQGFIDKISSKIGFTDGLVAIKDPTKESLKIVGITQNQTNKTILDILGNNVKTLEFPLSNPTNNSLVSVYQTGISKNQNKLADIWTPYVKSSDGQIMQFADNNAIFVYPIIFGTKILGSFALYLGTGAKTLTNFEEETLNRIVTVFGVAIDRIRINEELRLSQERELSKAKERIKDINS